MQKIRFSKLGYIGVGFLVVASVFVVGGHVARAVTPTPTPVPTQPNLVSINLTVPATPIVVGQSITFSANTKNFGSAAGASKSAFCIDNTVTCKNTFTGRLPGAGHDISALSPTAISNTFTSVAWTATVGTHTVTVCSDVNNQVTEQSESDNCTSRSFTVINPSPNLISQNLTILTLPVTGEVLRFTANAKNTGIATSGVSKSAFCIDNTTTCKNTFTGRITGPGNDIPVLVANTGSSTFTSDPWTATTIGLHTVTVCSDVNNQVTESNENDNCLSRSFTVEASVPNLISQNLTVPTNLITGQQLRFTAYAKNTGITRAGASKSAFCIDNTTTCKNTFTGRISGPGNNIPQLFLNDIFGAFISDPWIATLGAHAVTVCADVNNQVTETNENDNCISTNFTVLAAPTPTPPTPYPDTPTPNPYDPMSPTPNGYDGGTGTPNAYTIQPTPVPLTAIITSPLVNSTFALGQDIPVAVSGNGTPSCGYWTLRSPSGQSVTLYSYDFVSGKQPSGMQSCAESERVPY